MTDPLRPLRDRLLIIEEQAELLREQAMEMAVRDGRAAPTPWRGGDC